MISQDDPAVKGLPRFLGISLSRLIDFHLARAGSAFTRGNLAPAYRHWRARRALERFIPDEDRGR